MIKETINKDKSDKKKFFDIHTKFTSKVGIYTYDKDQLILFKDIDKVFKDEHVMDIFQINDNEFLFYAKQKGKIYGENDFLIFYDIQTDKIIKKLKVGKGEIYGDMILINKNNLIILGDDDEIILIDVKNKKKINKFNFKIYNSGELIILNDNKFLNTAYDLEQYELENSNTIRLKEKKKIDKELISKYPGNKLIAYSKKKLQSMGRFNY